MATVTLPSLFNDTTGGRRRVEVPGTTLGEVIDALEAAHPGLAARLLKKGRLVPYLAVTVDGKIAAEGLTTPLAPTSDVVVLFNMGGG